MWIKICGVRTLEAALHAQACGADAVGLNLHPGSVRAISAARATEICSALAIESILVVANRTEKDIAALVHAIGADTVQLHGSEPPGFGARLHADVFKAFPARPGIEDQVLAFGKTRFLLDAWVPGRLGGTGCRVAPSRARELNHLGEMILAGGLSPENVAEVIGEVQPFGVDVASGVESAPGEQDLDRISAFIQAARSG